MSSRARVKRLTGIKSDLDAVTKPGSTHHLCNGISTVKGQRGTGSRKDEHITIQRRLSRKTWPKALRTSDWAGGSRTMTLIKPSQCKSVLEMTVNIEWPRQSLDLRNLNMSVHWLSPSNLTQLERICRTSPDD